MVKPDGRISNKIMIIPLCSSLLLLYLGNHMNESPCHSFSFQKDWGRVLSYVCLSVCLCHIVPDMLKPLNLEHGPELKLKRHWPRRIESILFYHWVLCLFYTTYIFWLFIYVCSDMTMSWVYYKAHIYSYCCKD